MTQGQSIGIPFPKGDQYATQTEQKIMNKRKVKRQRNSDTENGKREPNGPRSEKTGLRGFRPG